jgi:hypothetical protein
MTKDKALKLALEALIWTTGSGDFGKGGQAYEGAKNCLFPAITALKEALAQPEQEPVAWMNDSTPSGIFARHMEGAKNFGCTIPLYTAPPQRTWVGLTDEEINDCLVSADPCECLAEPEARQLVEDVEAKLKDKNT